MTRLRELRRRHGSIRLRLALMSAALFLALGTVLIVVIFTVGRPSATVNVTAVDHVVRPGPLGGSGLFLTPTGGLHQQRVEASGSLLAVSWILLVLTAIASIPLGWFASGWMLRPLRRITARTRMISAGNLHERLALSGPRDEFTELGDTLDDLLARLEAAFDAQRRFVANASHELRTPLTVERTLLQVALADPNASAVTLRAVCEELLASGREHERLLEAMLTFAASERGLDAGGERVDIGTLALGVLEAPRPEIEAQQLTLTTDLQPAETLGDPALIERLIANLIDNAVRYNVPGGHVEVRAARTGASAVLTVENSGPTVREDEIEAMFEPFRRLGRPRTGTDGGQHGLGLSIVRAIANAHGATVTARPRTGGGLIIAVAFAAAPDAGPHGPA